MAVYRSPCLSRYTFICLKCHVLSKSLFVNLVHFCNQVKLPERNEFSHVSLLSIISPPLHPFHPAAVHY